MKTAYDKLIEKTSIEEDYGMSFTNYGWKNLNKRFENFLNEFNLKIM